MLRYGVIQADAVALWNNPLRPMGQIYFCHWTVIITVYSISCHQYGAEPFSFSMLTYFSIGIMFNLISMKLWIIFEFFLQNKHLLLKCWLYDASDPFHFASILLSRSWGNSAVSWHQGQFYGCSTGQLAWHMPIYSLHFIVLGSFSFASAGLGKLKNFTYFM